MSAADQAVRAASPYRRACFRALRLATFLPTNQVALAAGLTARRATRLRAPLLPPLPPAFVPVVLLGMPAVILSARSYLDRGRRQPSATDGARQPGIPGEDNAGIDLAAPARGHVRPKSPPPGEDGSSAAGQ